MSLLGLNSGEEEMMGREELLVELSKFKKLKAELKEMVECPVIYILFNPVCISFNSHF